MKAEYSMIVDKLRKYIRAQIPQVHQLNSSDEVQLIENGYLDSLGVLDVVSFLEEEFNISVDDEDLTPDNFQSINTMALFVQQKQNGYISS